MLCRAKVNLTLHVGAPLTSGRWTGYHPVESLVVFADLGDELNVQQSQKTTLQIGGPFGEGLTVGTDNLILKAMIACDAPPHKIELTKNLPIASGLGGGSTNAAAILRKFDPDMQVDAAGLGADVPVCRLSQTAMMEGIGERVTPLPDLGRVAAVLANPRIPVSTGEIFRRFDSTLPAEHSAQTARVGSLLDRAKSGQNDLETAAIELEPVIGSVLDAISGQEGCDLARMSGSGATCFGLFSDYDAAIAASEHLAERGWWAVPTWLGDDA